MDTLTIVGVGLIGGSFALALRKAGFRGRILGVSSPATIERALARGAIDEGLSLAQAVPQSDLVYLAQPILRILDTLPALDSLLRGDALVTDAGSTKRRIVEAAGASIRHAQFLGGHPMAGKEKRGVEEADPDLVQGRTYVLTPATPEALETPRAKEFLAWLPRIGAVPLVLSPEEHDRVVSHTSHLPQLVSTALASLLAERLESADHLRAAGPGLADTTRLAMSAFDVWGDILKTNDGEIDQALAAFIEKVEELRRLLRDERMRREFERAAEFARRLREKQANELS
jgi:prephenate dehydrogenase